MHIERGSKKGVIPFFAPPLYMALNAQVIFLPGLIPLPRWREGGVAQ